MALALVLPVYADSVERLTGAAKLLTARALCRSSMPVVSGFVSGLNISHFGVLLACMFSDGPAPILFWSSSKRA